MELHKNVRKKNLTRKVARNWAIMYQRKACRELSSKACIKCSKEMNWTVYKNGSIELGKKDEREAQWN